MKTIVSILLVISLLCGVGAAQTYHIELYPTDDAYIDSENPTTNYGGTGWLYADTDIWNSDTTPNQYERSYLKFDLSLGLRETYDTTHGCPATCEMFIAGWIGWGFWRLA